MGGSKKVSPAKQEKAQSPKEPKKVRKDKGEGGPSKSEITVIVKEPQAVKIIQNAKVITAHDLARQVGVKISAANAFLRNAAKKGTVKSVGGYSGHYIYQSSS